MCSVDCEFCSNDFVAAVLDRVRGFLPIVDEANRKLMAGIEEKGQQESDIEAVGANGAAPQHRDGIRNKFLLSSSNTYCCHLLRHRKFIYPNVCLRMRSLANSTFKLYAVAVKGPILQLETFPTPETFRTLDLAWKLSHLVSNCE